MGFAGTAVVVDSLFCVSRAEMHGKSAFVYGGIVQKST